MRACLQLGLRRCPLQEEDKMARRFRKRGQWQSEAKEVVKVKIQQSPVWSPLYNSGHYFTNEETTLKGFMYRNKEGMNDAQANGFQMVLRFRGRGFGL